MAMTLSLDHIILPKDVTDGFYLTWHTYYGELFPSPVKPKYRPMSKLLSTCEDDDITQSSPNINFVNVLTPDCGNQSPLITNVRVGDNIDEFIRNNRKQILTKSNSLNDIMQSLATEKEKTNEPSASAIGASTKMKPKDSQLQQELAEKYGVKLRSKSDLAQYSEKKSNRFSWCGSQTIKFFNSFQGKRKTYECMNERERFDCRTYDFNSNAMLTSKEKATEK